MYNSFESPHARNLNPSNPKTPNLKPNPPTPNLQNPCNRAQVREPSAVVEHEASTSKISEDQLFYFQQRGIDPEKAVGAIISGFCREVGCEMREREM